MENDLLIKMLSSKELGHQQNLNEEYDSKNKIKFYKDIYKSFSIIKGIDETLIKKIQYEPPKQNYSQISPQVYWTAMSFPNSQCCKSSITLKEENDALQNYEDLIAIVNSIFHQNIKFFENFKIKLPRTRVWNLDGVSACGKSSTIKNIQKTNTRINCIGQNTHLGGHMGYLITSIKMMTESKANTIWDRTAYNNTLWFSIWEIIAHIKGNAESYNQENYTNTYCESLITDKNMIKLLGNHVLTDSQLLSWNICMNETRNDIYDWLASNAKTILLVDSNELNATTRLSKRNKGHDLERSNWLHYIRAQNFAYMYLATKFPEDFCIIDLNYLNGNQTLMQKIVRYIINKYKINDANPISFKPLRCATVKPILTPRAQEFERTRNFQQLKFTKNLKYLAINRDYNVDTTDTDTDGNHHHDQPLNKKSKIQ